MEACKNLGKHKHRPKIGCSKSAHYALGWCSGPCSSHTMAEECVAWRVIHMAEDHDHTPEEDKAYNSVCPEHKLVQHRDGKKPWCRKCGRDEMGNVIGRVRSWLKV